MEEDKCFVIHIYGPESDYIYEEIAGLQFKKVADAKKWINRNIPKHLGYKIVKVQTVFKCSPAKPHYVT